LLCVSQHIAQHCKRVNTENQEFRKTGIFVD